MIRIQVDLFSAVSPDRSRPLGTAVIFNRREKTLATGGVKGDYTIRIFGRGRNRNKIWREANVEDFPRKSKTVWYLIQRLLNEALKEN